MKYPVSGIGFSLLHWAAYSSYRFWLTRQEHEEQVRALLTVDLTFRWYFLVYRLCPCQLSHQSFSAVRRRRNHTSINGGRSFYGSFRSSQSIAALTLYNAIWHCDHMYSVVVIFKTKPWAKLESLTLSLKVIIQFNVICICCCSLKWTDDLLSCHFCPYLSHMFAFVCFISD